MRKAQPPPEAEQFLTTAEVARLLWVHPETVNRRAREGKITSIRTPGGVIRRYHAAQFGDRPGGNREGGPGA